DIVLWDGFSYRPEYDLIITINPVIQTKLIPDGIEQVGAPDVSEFLAAVVVSETEAGGGSSGSKLPPPASLGLVSFSVTSPSPCFPSPFTVALTLNHVVKFGPNSSPAAFVPVKIKQ
ncbi:hypothetical protein HK102_009760, partial [Quaeritorhiza haematococci]